MIYKLYFSNSGVAKTGLTPTVTTFKKVSDNSDVTPKPTISEIGGGWYKTSDYAAAEDIVGVVDGGAGVTANIDRYVPLDITPNDPNMDLPSSLLADLVESQRGAHTWQGNYFYVDPVNGDTHANGARGGRSDPYSLVQDCLDNAVTDSNHDVIFLVAGSGAGATTLTEDVTINKRYTFLRGPGRDFNWTRAGAGDTIMITADGVEVSGVQIFTDSIGVGNGIEISSADFVKIRKCWLNDTQGDAINISNSDNVQILKNHLQYSGQSGAGHGIVIDSAGGSSNFPIIEDNVLHHVAGDGIKLLGGNVDHPLIRNNVIHDCEGYGINVGGGVVEAYLIDNKLADNDSGDINDQGTDTALHNNQTIEDSVWDPILTAATHNIPRSAGRRLRNISSMIITDGTCPSAPLLDNEIILNGDAFITDGAYDPAMVFITGGTGEGQCRNILEYDGATRTATVDRNWKVDPDDTSEYSIAANPGREHVNEGRARAGTVDTIKLNVLASSDNNAYRGQVIFLRSGTGEDQANRVMSYDGTTKIATVEEPWAVIPDTTTGYVMLPTGSFVSVDVGTIGGAPVSGDVITGIYQSKVTVREGRDIVVYVGDYPTLELVAPSGWDFTNKRVFLKTALEPGGTLKISKEATVTGTTTAESSLTGAELDEIAAYEAEYYQTDADGTSNPLTIARFRLSVRQDV